MPQRTITITALIALVLAASGWSWFYFNRSDWQKTVSTKPISLKSLPFVESLQPKPTRSATTTLIAFGDIMLSRNVAGKMRLYGNDYPFLKMMTALSSADIAFANLENPITAGPIVPTGSFTFHADPGSEIALKQSGIDIVSLANNHSPNYGEKGLLDTITYLDQQSVLHAGAGKDLSAALEPAVIERNGVKFAFVAFNDTDVVPPSYGAGVNHAGTALIDFDHLHQAMVKAKSLADVVIVSMHAGTEYTPEANKRQIAFAHAAIDEGADVVIGHHPHVVQNIEKYKDKYIFYSLGNFIFDQMFSDETRNGLGIRLSFVDKKVVKVELLPVLIEDYAQPHSISPREATSTMQRLQQLYNVQIVDGVEVGVLK
jgi:poly-gamma-glutamate synthesis protein (capsule biosynthesis protein)